MSDHSQFNKYIPSFLLRGQKRRDSTEKARPKRDKVKQLKYEEAVTQSLGNLVNVASSVSLPAGATHKGKERGTSLQIPQLDCLIHGNVRRHSYDCVVSKSKTPIQKLKQYDSDRESSGRSSGSDQRYGSNLSIGQSTSTEPSPIHKKTDKHGMLGRALSKRSMYSDLGHSTSVNTSDKESDVDDEIYVRQTPLSQNYSTVFNLSEDDSDFYSHQTGSHTSQESSTRQRHNVYSQHNFFILEVRLQEGRDLVVRDSCGTSDPYVKFKYNGKQVYKSRTVYKNLNPQWDDSFTVPIEDIAKPLQMKVFDYDRGLHDDPMGSADIDLTTIELNRATEVKCMLSEVRGKSEYMGYLVLNCKIVPKSQEEKDQFFRKSLKTSDSTSSKKLKSQIWNSVVTIVLVNGRNLVPMDDNGLSDPYVKFRLGNEKYKSKFKSKTLSPSWLEQFDLRLFDDQTSQLEITVYDHDVTGKDDFMGRAMIDLDSLPKEKTHILEVPLEDGAGIIKLLLTISGSAGNETVSDLSNYTPNPKEREELIKHYGLTKSLQDIKDVGWLQVKVFKAQGLKAADFGGLSDPFCVLELVNSRLQTQTEYKTLNPDWNKVFTFNVKDIHSVLDITVYDEDRDKKVEFLGRLSIPLLKIKVGERRWYALKDKKLLHKTKGAILLEFDFVFNHVKAAIRTVNPKEEKYMQPEQKFKISILKRNIDRVSQVAAGFVEGGKFLQSCFDWESKPRSIIAFIVYLIVVWIFEPYMLPITLLLVFLKNLIVAQIVGAFKKEPVEDDYVDEDDDDDDEDKDKATESKEEKKSFKEKLQAIQEVCLQVQQGMDMVASMGERIKNTFNWTVPWLSALAVIVLMVGVTVLYYIPIRLLLMAWGINKFTKKLRKPDAIPNNELLDFLSRVPSDSELIQYRDLRPDLTSAQMSKKKRA